MKKTIDGIVFIEQENGARLSATEEMGLIEQDGFLFKDLARTGRLEPYADWRLDAEARAQDLAGRLDIPQIAGLMLHASHQMVPFAAPMGPMGGHTYGGKPFRESGALPSDLSDQQKEFITNRHVRHLLVAKFDGNETLAAWSNKIQKTAEAAEWGIPISLSSDPRHIVSRSSAEFMGEGGSMSVWPSTLGLSATFDPAVARDFARTAAREYRALGISTALSPQVDLATDPRWSRYMGTFGEQAQLVTDMSRAYCDGMQTSFGEAVIAGGWGHESVNAMAKHWPGGGSGESGRDAHFSAGKYAVYPGGNQAEHLKPFLEGAFKLEGGTGSASAIMPYYTISHFYDEKSEEVGNSFDRHLITDLLRDRYGYDGLVCTDWGIMGDQGPAVDTFAGKCWGMETATEAERFFRAMEAGVDQYGGIDSPVHLMEAYRMGVEKYGESAMRARFEQSAVRILRNLFRVGLFEHPFLEVAVSAKTVGCDAFREAGREAQRKSLVLVKNKGGVLPLTQGMKIFIPKRTLPASNFFGHIVPERVMDPVNLKVAGSFFNLVETPEEADAAVVFISSPTSDFLSCTGYSKADAAAGGNGYVPISLQFEPYTARIARTESLAGGDPLEPSANRSYKGKSTTTQNAADLAAVREVKMAMGDKPVIVSLYMMNPCVVSEFEGLADAILIDFGVEDRVLFETLDGTNAPTGLLPFQIPKDMETVEIQDEDVGLDMNPYKDGIGNLYDFGFGLGFRGKIRDGRLDRYRNQ